MANGKELKKLIRTNLVDLLRKMEISSREIAEYTGKEHKNVLVDIRRIQEELKNAKSDISRLEFQPRDFTSRGRLYPEFMVNKEACLLIITGYDLDARLAIQNRWLQLEEEMSARKEAAIALDENRKKLAADYRALSEAVDTVYRREGREPTSLSYMKWAKLLWHAFTGEFKEVDRSALDMQEVKDYDELERIEASLLMMNGRDAYELVKECLRDYAVKRGKLAYKAPELPESADD